MTYSKAIIEAFNKYDAVRLTDIDTCASTPAQKMVETKAFRKLTKLIEAEGMSVNKVVPELIKMTDKYADEVLSVEWNAR